MRDDDKGDEYDDDDEALFDDDNDDDKSLSVSIEDDIKSFALSGFNRVRISWSSECEGKTCTLMSLSKHLGNVLQITGRVEEEEEEEVFDS